VFIRLALVLLLTPVLVSAQGRGGGGGGGGGSLSAHTPFEEFVGRLKLDEKEQLPAVQQIFAEADTAAGPVVQELSQLRLRLLNLELAGTPDQAAAIVTAHSAAAAKMTMIEIRALERVSAQLKSRQLSRRSEAFVVMGGIFYPPPPVVPRSGRSEPAPEAGGAR
jgi:hypothetical protein